MVSSKRSPRPRNDPWDAQDFSASVPIERGIIYTKVAGPYKARDRKLWPVLVHHAWQSDESLSEPQTIPIAKIARLFSEHGGDTSARWIWDSTKRLAKTQLEWVNVEGRRRQGMGFSVLLSSAQIKKDHRLGVFTLTYTIPSPLCELLKDPDQYGRIRTQLLLSLSSKYTISLYEVLTTVVNREKPELKVTLPELRVLLKVPEDKLTRWHHLRQRALDPAIDELNERQNHSGFRVEYEVERGARNSVVSLTFRTEKTKEQLLEEQVLRALPSQTQLNLFDSGEMEPVLSSREIDSVVLQELHDDDFRKKVRQVAPGRDIGALEQEWLEWARFKPDFPPSDVRKAFLGFCRRKGGSARS